MNVTIHDDGHLSGPLREVLEVYFDREAAKKERRRHNDNGPHGVCTDCGELHGPVWIVHGCLKCGRPCENPEARVCPACFEGVVR